MAKLVYEAIITPIGNAVLGCIDGKRGCRNPFDKRSRLWMFRLAMALGKKCGFKLGGLADDVDAGAVSTMVNATGAADSGIAYASTEVEGAGGEDGTGAAAAAQANSSTVAEDEHAKNEANPEVDMQKQRKKDLGSVVAAKKHGRRWGWGIRVPTGGGLAHYGSCTAGVASSAAARSRTRQKQPDLPKEVRV